MHFTKYSIIILFVFLLTPFASAEFVENTIESADGVPISYRVQGEGEPTLVFIHGWLGNQGFWDAQREFFAQTHKVVTFDLAGHGSSGQERQEWSIEAFGDDLTVVLNTLELKNAILVGHALGGLVAVETARKLPEQVIGIIGVDTLQDFELSATVEQHERIISQLENGYPALVERAALSMFSPDVAPALTEKILPQMLSVPQEVGIATMQAALTYKLLPAVQALSIPIRGINSDASPVNVPGNKEHAKSYEVMLVPGSKHLFFLESPDEFNSVLSNVLQELSEYNANEEIAKAAE